MSKDTVYLPPMRLVSFEEKVELLTEELLGLSPESRVVLLEIIRLTWHIEQGIDKRRLLSDAPTGRGNTDNPPGDTRMAGLLINLQRHLKRLAARKRKQQERMIGDLWKVVNDFLKQMDKIEGHNDPERVRERLAKKAEKEESVTV
ncbi:MAG: hypothetical protein ACYC5F_09670 [Thermoleophilia bacterium]